MQQNNITIIGSGIVGLTTSILLAKNPDFNITLIEANPISSDWNKEIFSPRVSAISIASQKIFEKINAWPKILKKRTSPYHHMHVWDNETSQIHFDCREVQEPQLGFIIEDNVIRTSLLETIQEYPNIHLLFPEKLSAIHEEDAETRTLILENNKTIKTKLLIGADGAHSKVRELSSITWQEKSYDHTAIVTTVRTTLPHQKTAWQRFLPEGVLAFLPLSDEHLCSIVWSTSKDCAEKLLKENEKEFCESLSNAFEKKLGIIQSATPRHAFPLHMRHVNQYVKNRIALIGDAAHTIHPLAGQGVNLGLLDALALSEVVLKAAQKNRDFSSYATLRQYERSRKGNNLLMLQMVGTLKSLFASDSKTLCSLRSTGLKITQALPFIKNFLVNYALGKTRVE